MCDRGPVGADLENHLISRAMRDEQFLALLHSDPKAAVEAEIRRLGLPIKLPENLKVKVLEEAPDTIYLIVPPRTTTSAQYCDSHFMEVINSLNLSGQSSQTS